MTVGKKIRMKRKFEKFKHIIGNTEVTTETKESVAPQSVETEPAVAE